MGLTRLYNRERLHTLAAGFTMWVIGKIGYLPEINDDYLWAKENTYMILKLHTTSKQSKTNSPIGSRQKLADQTIDRQTTADLENVVNRPQAENSELDNVLKLKIAYFVTMDEQKYMY